MIILCQRINNKKQVFNNMILFCLKKRRSIHQSEIFFRNSFEIQVRNFNRYITPFYLRVLFDALWLTIFFPKILKKTNV